MYIFNEEEFANFLKDNPSLRFWQAMRAYLGVDRIEVIHREDESMEREDTFYWQDEKS